MGIESIGSVTSGQSFQNAAAAKPAVAKPVVTEVPEVVATEVVKPEVASQVANQSTANQAVADEKAKETVTKPAKDVTSKDVVELNKIINRKTSAEFGYNEPTGRITIKIKDRETDEVIREIPSDKALEMLAKAWELAGILVDEKR